MPCAFRGARHFLIQYDNMKKYFLSLFVSLVFITTALAQTDTIATVITNTIAIAGPTQRVSPSVMARVYRMLNFRAIAVEGVLTERLRDTAAALRLLASAPQMQSVAFVSPNGNDTTAQKGNINKTYATLQAAKSSGANQIHVFGGSYTVTGSLSGNISWYFYDATINHFGTIALFYDNLGVRTVVRGGKIISSGDVIKVTHQNSELDLMCEKIITTGSNSAILDSDFAPYRKVKVVADSIIASKFVLGRATATPAGDRANTTKGELYVKCDYMISACPFDVFIGYKNYNIYLYAKERKGLTANDGGFIVGYGVIDCKITMEGENWEGRIAMGLSNGFKNSTLTYKVRNFKSSFGAYLFQISCNNIDNVNSSIFIQDCSLTQMHADNAGACFNLGNHNGHSQAADFKVYVTNCVFSTLSNPNASPIALGGNNKMFIRNTHLISVTPSIFKGYSGVNDGTPIVYNGGGLSAKTGKDANITLEGEQNIYNINY